MADQRIYVDGLRDLRRALQALDEDLDTRAARNELRAELKEVAELAAQRIRLRVPYDTSRRRKQRGVAEHWRDKISAGASQRSAYVTWGRGTVPYAGWLEFGGTRKGRGGGEATRPRTPDGRFVFPEVARARSVLERNLAERLDRLIRRHGLD